MSFEQHTARIERLIGLIECSRTGTADDLAKTLSVSRRTIFNDIDFLKGRGYAIYFCNVDFSYRFEKKRNNP